jgi:hypothetical protein
MTKGDRTDLEREHSRRKQANPGNISEDPAPHHTLSNPAEEPDETEWPDPYEKREDPRGPDSERGPDGSFSTSEPPPPHDKDELKPVKGDSEGG